jgi:hypothetical protein
MKTLFYRKVAFWFVMLFSASLISLQAQDVSRYAIDDAVISQIYPDSVIDQSQVGNNILAYRQRVDESLLRVMSYIKFDISAAAGKTVEAANFSFRGAVRGEAEEFADEFKVQLRGVTGQWNGTEVTWNTRPTTGGNVLAESFLSTNSARKDFVAQGTRLIDFINEEIRKGSKTISFEIRSAAKDSTELSWLGGMLNGAWGPVLNFTVAPQKTGYAIDDAVISQLYPDSVIDQSQVGNNILAYRVREDETLYRVMSYIKFDISGASGKMLESANLSFRGALRAEAAEFENDFKLQLRGVTGDWDGEAVTWNTRPATIGNVLAESFLTTNSGRKDFVNTGTGLIDFINEEIRKGKRTISLEIRSSGKDSTELSWLGGMLNGSFGPVLNFTFTPESSGYAIDDAVISQIHPDSVIDQSQVGNNILAYRERVEAGLQRVMSYLKFDISAAEGRTLESINLSYRGALRPEAEEFANDFLLQLRGVTGEWNGESVTWDARPATGGNVLAESFLTTSSARKDFISQGTRLLDFVNEEIRKGKKNCKL